MHVNDLAEVMSVLGKLNRTIDEQQQLIDQYVAKFGPPQVAFAEEMKKQEADPGQNGQDTDREKAKQVIEETLTTGPRP